MGRFPGGVFSMGMFSVGVFPMGGFSMDVFSMDVFSMGVLSMDVFSMACSPWVCYPWRVLHGLFSFGWLGAHSPPPFVLQGDSGSPLICEGTFRAVTSFGKQGRCGDPWGPGVYTLLSQKHLNWIRKTIRRAA